MSNKTKNNKTRPSSSSAVISAIGAHSFTVDNSPTPTRREELVYATVEEIHRTIRNSPVPLRGDTRRLKKAAEKLHDKQKNHKRDLARVNREFQKLTCAIGNQPQYGFNMGDFISKLRLAPASVVEACTVLKDAISKTTETVHRITDLVKEAIPWITSFLEAAVLCVCAGTLIFAIVKKKPVLAGTSAALISALAIAKGYLYQKEITQLLQKITDKIADQARVYVEPVQNHFWPENKAQGDDIHTDTLVPIDQSIISKLFVAMFSCGFFAMGEKNKNTFSLLKDYVVHFPSMIKGIDQVTEFSSKIVLSMLNHVRSGFGYGVYDCLWTNKDPFLNWMDKVTKFLNAWAVRDVKVNIQSLGLINQFIEEGRRHSLFLRSVTDDPGARSRISQVLTDLAKARDSCVHLNQNIVASRPEPVCVYLYGEPGRGKTKFARLLAQAWLKLTLEPHEYSMFESNHSAYIYNRTPETQFWDGYANQTVCIFDDFLQKKEVAGGEAVSLDMIRCLNNNPALLHMASLNEKGQTYFTSRLVILSSNIQVPQSEAIMSQVALQRRPDIYLRVDFQDELLLKSEYLGSSGVNTLALAAIASCKTWEEQTSVYVLQKYDIGKQDRQAHDVELMTPRQVRDFIVGKTKSNDNNFRCVLPEMPAERLVEANDLLTMFLERNDAIAFNSSFKIKPPGPNVAQVGRTIREVMVDSRTFKRLFKTYTDVASSTDGPELNKICAEMEDFLKTEGIPWQDFLEATSTMQSWCRCKREGGTLKSQVTDALRSLHPEIDQDNNGYFSQLFILMHDKFCLLTTSVKGFFVSYWPFIIGTATAFGVAIALYQAFRYWTKEPNQAESIPSRQKSHVTSKDRWAMFRHFNRQNNPSNVAQCSEAMRSQLDKLLGHTYHLFWEPKSECAVGHITMLADRIALTNAHTCDMVQAQYEKGSRTVFLRKFGNVAPQYEVPALSFVKAHRNDDTIHLDVVLVYFPNSNLPMAPNFLEHIPPFSDLEHRTQLNIVAPIITKNTEAWRNSVDPMARVNCDRSGPYGKFSNRLNITYAMHTTFGQCGLPIVTDTLSQGKYFVGIHKCGNGILAGAAPLVREWVENEIVELKKVYPEMKVLFFQEISPLASPPNNFPQCHPAHILGVTKPFHSNNKSTLHELPHSHMFEQTTAPAVLDLKRIDGRWISPYIQNREGMPSLHRMYPDVPQLTELVSKIVNDSTLKEMLDLGFWRKTRTFEEAIFGIPGTLFSSLDMSTSVGYPMVLTGKTTKRSWVEDPVLFKRLRDEVSIAEALLKRGILPSFLTMDFLKDERRPLEKVALAKSRVIAGGSFVLLIICRMYFGAFATWTTANKIDNGITIGMNPYSDQFDYMCRQLFKPLYKIFTGDSKAFDLHEHPTVLLAVFDAINDWYGREDEASNGVRRLLATDFMYSKHVCPSLHAGIKASLDLASDPKPIDPFEVSASERILNATRNPLVAWVYQQNGGHPTGHYLTAVLNSWYSRVKPFIVAQYHVRDLSTVLRWHSQRQLVVQTLGDDFITSCGPDVQKVVNALSFKEFSALYGMTVTRENKEPITEAFPNDPPVFLKRLCMYSPDHGRYVGAMDKHAIIDAMCWMCKKDPTDHEMQQSFDTALCEFSFWGPKVYNEWAPKIEQAARHTLRRTYVASSWEQATRDARLLDADFRP